MSGRVALRLVLPSAVVTWFVTSFRIPGRSANVPASRSGSCMISAMNRARLFGEQRRSAVIDPQTVRWAAPGCSRRDAMGMALRTIRLVRHYQRISRWVYEIITGPERTRGREFGNIADEFVDVLLALSCADC